MVQLRIDDRQIEVPEGTTVLQAAEQLGIVIPRFCYHKRLSIAGNCRMCLVEIEGAKNLVISCKEPVREGMAVRTDTDLVKRARADVLEFILLNHPIDCPICDQAGECDLQNYYFAHSLRPRRSREPKVRKPKAQLIGPHVMLDSERCVECTRCIRFCEEVAGVHEIGLFERGDHSTIGVLPGREMANPYSLCAVDLCPVGALTSVEFRFRKRAWFLESTPSICPGCATGCNIWIDHADSIVYRFRPRENESINKSWLCDAGRMTYREHLADERALLPLLAKDGELIETSWHEALKHVAGLVQNRKAIEVVGILSARSSNEENEAAAGLCREALRASRLVWVGRASDKGFGDAILRDADRNPNAAGVQKIACDRLGNLKPDCGFIVLGGLEGDDLLAVVESRPAWVILLASRRPDGRWADVVLPKATHAEQEGTFVNRNGISQRTAKAFDPIGESAPAGEIAERIAKAIGEK